MKTKKRMVSVVTRHVQQTMWKAKPTWGECWVKRCGAESVNRAGEKSAAARYCAEHQAEILKVQRGYNAAKFRNKHGTRTTREKFLAALPRWKRRQEKQGRRAKASGPRGSLALLPRREDQ